MHANVVVNRIPYVTDPSPGMVERHASFDKCVETAKIS
jgi:hypothetical protein